VSKADDVFYRQFGLVLIALTLFTLIVFFAARAIGANSFEKMQSSPSAVLDRIKPFGQVRVGKPDEVVMAAAPASQPAAPASQPAAPASQPAAPAAAGGGQSGEQIYNTTCVACHSTGVAGAPKVGDKAVWEARLAQGLDAMVGSSVKGKGAMPPKGGNAGLSDDDIKSAVEFMLEKSGLQPG
jgi:cytochrome c5